MLLYIFCYLGGLFVEKRPQTAVQVLAFSESLAQAFPTPRHAVFDKPYFERFLAAARANLCQAEFASAWEAGLKMTVDDAVELALKAVEGL